MTHFLVPADPFDRAKPDDTYADEAAAFRAAGFAVSLFSFEEFEGGFFKARPAIPSGASIVYRGWMLSAGDYERLSIEVAKSGARMRTSSEQYRLCHYLPEWYVHCRDLTPKTVFVAEHQDPSALLQQLGPPPYFVKDHVKSLTIARGSVAHSAQEIAEIVELLRKYRGRVEGGVCIREFVALRPETEERYFVVQGKPFSREGDCPQVVTQVASRIHAPFFSVDVVTRTDGSPVVIELGDGQVSDRKAWPVNRLVAALSAA